MAVEKTIVYRLEGKNNTGVYNGCHVSKAGLRSIANERQPMAWNDGLSYDLATHRFGFKDPKQIKAWFNAYERRDLSNVGVLVKIFEVSKKSVRYGGHQLTFNKKRAKLIGIKTLQEI